MTRCQRSLTGLVILSAALCHAGPALAQERSGSSHLEALQHAMQQAADRIAPSLVLIEVRRSGREPALTTLQKRRLGLLGTRYAEGYYKRPAGPVSGVVIDKRGTIITSRFNTSGTVSTLWVIAADGRRRKAKLLGYDPNLDIQALRVEDPSGLVPANIGDSKSLSPGRLAFLVARSQGSPRPVISQGLISAIGRKRKQAFQLSSRMNYGNVGGAVINLDGELIGIASHLSNRTPTGQNSGVGFAAPMHLVKKSYSIIVSGQNVPRIKNPFLGIQGSTRPPKKGEKGVRIERVLPNTAAAKAKLKGGDVITIFNGAEVNDFLALSEEIKKLSVGDEIIITVVRGGWAKDITVKIGARPEGQ